MALSYFLSCRDGTFILYPKNNVNPSFTKPFGTHTFYQRGGGSSRPLKLFKKTFAPMNVKFCRVLETPFKILEMLKLFK